MFEATTNEILLKFLDKKAKAAEEEITTSGILSEEHAIPLILKTLFNHVAHLDFEITQLRKSIDVRFERMEQRLNRLGTRIFSVLAIGFTLIAFLIVLFGFLN